MSSSACLFIGAAINFRMSAFQDPASLNAQDQLEQKQDLLINTLLVLQRISVHDINMFLKKRKFLFSVEPV